MAGKQVKLFLVNGTPGGLTTAEITNLTGHVVSGPRSRLADLLQRGEAGRTGAYLLLGDDPVEVTLRRPARRTRIPRPPTPPPPAASDGHRRRRIINLAKCDHLRLVAGNTGETL